MASKMTAIGYLRHNYCDKSCKKAVIRANIDFEFFFPIITGKRMVNTKGVKRFK